MSSYLYWLVASAILVTLLWILRCLIRRGLAPDRIPEQRTPSSLGLSFDDVTIPTGNGKKLSAWFIPAGGEGRAPTVAILHGWGGNAEMMLPLAGPLHAAGFASLFLDARCHGRSDEDTFASMPRFAEDLEGGLAWLAARPGVDAQRIAIVGHSVGAAAALLVASRRNDLAAVVSLAAFAHPATMMKRWLEGKGISYRPVGWLILAYVQHVIGHRFDDIAPMTTIRKVSCPTLLIHGAEDATVPAEEARQIHAARCGEHVQLRIVAGSHDDFGDGGDIAGEVGEVVGFLRANSGARDYYNPP